MKSLVVHSHPMLAATLAALMQRCGSRMPVVSTVHLDDAVRVASQGGGCAAVFLDAGCGSHDLRTAVARLARYAVPVIAIAPSVQQLHSALECGASGCLARDLDADLILAALLVLFLREPHEDDAAAATPCAAGARTSELTQRQRAVLRQICAGNANKDIGRELRISEKTVKTHVSAIFKALGVTNRTQAAVAAREEVLKEL